MKETLALGLLPGVGRTSPGGRDRGPSPTEAQLPGQRSVQTGPRWEAPRGADGQGARSHWPGFSPCLLQGSLRILSFQLGAWRPKGSGRPIQESTGRR